MQNGSQAEIKMIGKLVIPDTDIAFRSHSRDELSSERPKMIHSWDKLSSELLTLILLNTLHGQRLNDQVGTACPTCMRPVTTNYQWLTEQKGENLDTLRKQLDNLAVDLFKFSAKENTKKKRRTELKPVLYEIGFEFTSKDVTVNPEKVQFGVDVWRLWDLNAKPEKTREQWEEIVGLTGGGPLLQNVGTGSPEDYPWRNNDWFRETAKMVERLRAEALFELTETAEQYSRLHKQEANNAANAGDEAKLNKSNNAAKKEERACNEYRYMAIVHCSQSCSVGGRVGKRSDDCSNLREALSGSYHSYSDIPACSKETKVLARSETPIAPSERHELVVVEPQITAIIRTTGMREVLKFGSREEIARKCDMLPPSESGLLQLLSVFSEGWDLETMREIVSFMEVRMDSGSGSHSSRTFIMVEELIYTLVRSEYLEKLTHRFPASYTSATTPSSESQKEITRFDFMSDSLQAHCRVMLQQKGFEEKAREAHATIYLEPSKWRILAMKPLNLNSVIQEVELDLQNISSAFDWKLQAEANSAEEIIPQLLLFSPLWDKYPVEGLKHLERVLEVENLQPTYHIATLIAAASLSHQLSNREEMRGYLRQARDLLDHIPNPADREHFQKEITGLNFKLLAKELRVNMSEKFSRVLDGLVNRLTNPSR